LPTIFAAVFATLAIRMTHVSRTRRLLTLSAKLALAAGILAYLIVGGRDGFVRLWHEPKHWGMLAIGLACTLASITLTFVRWHVLVTALGLNFRLPETMRLGTLGFALNFVSLGSIGGDLFKAIFVAKDSPGRRTEAVATVIADRLLGVLMMLSLATAATFLIDWSAAPAAVKVLVQTVRMATIVGLCGAGLVLLVPALSGTRLQKMIGAVTLVGPTAARLIGAVATFRDQKRHLFTAAAISIVSNSLFILSFYFVARGLPVQAATLAQHFVIVPVANLAGAIPATPSGLGTMELAVEKLYQAVAGGAGHAGDGTLVALGQRATMILVAVVCLAYYLAHRGDLREVMHEVEEAEDAAEAM
jgi:uncharacterized protein (TIRG00374 family)